MNRKLLYSLGLVALGVVVLATNPAFAQRIGIQQKTALMGVPAPVTVTGAVIVLSTLSGASAGRSRSLASLDRRNANRAGAAFALVGAHFSSS